MRYTVIFLISSLLLYSCGRQNDYQKNIDLRGDWSFYPMDDPGLTAPEFDGDSWTTIDLIPYGESNMPLTNESIAEMREKVQMESGWYRKTFILEEENRGKSIYLYFSGIFPDPELWLNENFLQVQVADDNSQLYKISGNINYDGVNVINIRVDSSLSIPYSPGFHYIISQEAKIVVANPVHIRPGGVDIRVTELDSEADLEIALELINNNQETKKVKVISHIYHPENGKKAVVNSDGLTLDDRLNVVQITSIENPELSKDGKPVIYECVIDVLTSGNTILDTYVKRFIISNENED